MDKYMDIVDILLQEIQELGYILGQRIQTSTTRRRLTFCFKISHLLYTDHN